MKQQRNSCFSPKVACMALALCGIGCFLGMGLTGEAQASPLALSQSIAADRAGAGGYAVTRINRSPGEKKCPRSADGCERPPVCPPDATVCPKTS